MQPCLRSLVAIAAGLFLLCDGAHAAGTAFASIANVRFAVADLTPDDGIAAGYDIAELRAELSAYTLLEHQSAFPPPYQASQVRVGNAAYFSQASVGSALGELTVESSADSSLGMSRAIQGRSQQTVWLTLQPHTALTLDGQAASSAQRLRDDGTDYFVETRLDVFLADGEWNELQWLKYGNLVLPTGDVYQAQAHDLALAYANDGDEATTVVLQLTAYGFIQLLPAVPEPATWAMLVAGFALMGGTAARRWRER